MAQPSQDELRRRLKAGRALRALGVKELAARIPSESRLGERTLRKLESGEQTLLPPTLRELAAALEVPYEWFTADDPSRLLTTPGRFDDLTAEIRGVREEVVVGTERVSNLKIEVLARIYERLDTIDRRLAAIEPSTTELLTQLTRRTKQGLAGPAAGDGRETPAAGSTRGASDATAEGEAVRPRGKRRSAGRPER